MQISLSRDGTWQYIGPYPRIFGKSPSAHKKVEAAKDFVTIWFDPNRWLEHRRQSGRIDFDCVEGTAFATLVCERIPIPLRTLHKIFGPDSRSTSRNARLILNELRIVNGVEVFCLKLEENLNSVPHISYGYYHTGPGGTVALVSYTTRDKFASSESELTDFLNGLEICNSGGSNVFPHPPTQFSQLSLQSGNIRLYYPNHKWTESKTTEDGDVTLRHTGGKAWAWIHREDFNQSIKSFDDFVLSQARQDVDANARIVQHEKRQVDGREEGYIKMHLSRHDTPMVLFNFYCRAAAGDFQLVTMTNLSLLERHQGDFLELLEGLIIKG